jgi:hypothetical protein
MIRRARGGAERLHLLESHDALLVEHGRSLDNRKALVRRAAALGDEQELVGVAIGGILIDLRGQVGAGVLLVEHVQRAFCE